ncbi:chemotaxis protein [Thermosipho sp. 1063]|uniref:chemotaxis protein CheB n=1 Tax=Thermosipho sp. 1063 TaxID=1462747 RepID=UPI00095091F9|nr:chemotaxis protein CheB [Thermosipho sp. 1063]APT72517.1 chemotaxis protein [Thermosipho sp. 1063]
MNKIIIVGSAGSPNNAVELVNINKKLNVPVIINIHFTGKFMESFAEHIRNTTHQNVMIVNNITELSQGIFLPAGGKSLIFISKDKVKSVEDKSTITHPSINTLFRSLIKYASSNFLIFVLSGLGNDGQQYIEQLQNKNVKFFIQKDANFNYLPNSYIRKNKNFTLLTLEKMKNIIVSLNNDKK